MLLRFKEAAESARLLGALEVPDTGAEIPDVDNSGVAADGCKVLRVGAGLGALVSIEPVLGVEDEAPLLDATEVWALLLPALPEAPFVPELVLLLTAALLVRVASFPLCPLSSFFEAWTLLTLVDWDLLPEEGELLSFALP